MEKEFCNLNGTIVIASPGTGKTTRLAKRVVELLQSGVQSKDILCITFTEKAAAEMQSKIFNISKEEGIDQSKLMDLKISTFHSYALDYLQEMGNSYQLISNNVLRYSIYKSFEANKAFNYSESHIKSELVPETENAIRYIKSFGITPDKINLEEARKNIKSLYESSKIKSNTLEQVEKFLEYFISAFKYYENSKKEGFIDYNDMLIKFIDHYDKDARHYKWVLVDELQDVNEMEARIAVASGDSLFLVGDRKQSIFGFQGGSIRNFNSLRESGLQIEKLSENHRSKIKIVEYSKTAFINKIKSREEADSYKDELKDFSSKKDGGAIRIVNSQDQYSSAIKILKDLNSELNKTAIITRTNDQLLYVSKLLDSEGIKYKTTASNSTSEAAKREIIDFLKGFYYEDKEYIASALNTVFAGLPLYKAKDLNKEEMTLEEIKKQAPEFFELREKCSGRIGIKNIFEDIIFPISAQIGMDYFITARAILSNINEFYEIIGYKDPKDLFDYISIMEENYEPPSTDEGVTLTTVHKAKGLEFDNVIYIPKSSNESRTSFIDVVTLAIIKSAIGIEVSEELREEESRVDFVAITRAKNLLYIIPNEKSLNSYKVDGISEDMTVDENILPKPEAREYNEAYALFVNGDYEGSKELLSHKELWAYNEIKDYFSKVNKISFSTISSFKDPVRFLKENILNISYPTESLKKGLTVHQMAEQLFKGKVNEEMLTQDEKQYLNNLKKLREKLAQETNAKQIAAEESISVPLKSLVSSAPEEMVFKGKIDGVYADENGRYMLIDYKTDKTEDYNTDHRRQLGVYKRLYSLEHNIGLGNISLKVIYVGLKGNINTGKMEYDIVDAGNTETLYKNFLKSLEEFLGCKKDPSRFIGYLKEKAEKDSEDLLLSRIMDFI